MDTLENDDYSGQLRNLRLILGTNFRQISTATLGAMVHLEPSAIRGIESGRRQMNDDDRAHLRVYLGTRWDDETHQWVCTGPYDKLTPFDRLEYQMHAQGAGNARALVDINQPGIVEAMEILFGALQGRESQVAQIKIYNQILASAEENHLSDELILELQMKAPLQPNNPEQTFPVRIPDTEGKVTARSKLPMQTRKKKDS